MGNDSFYQELGFESEAEAHKMVGQINLDTPKKMEAYIQPNKTKNKDKVFLNLHPSKLHQCSKLINYRAKKIRIKQQKQLVFI